MREGHWKLEWLYVGHEDFVGSRRIQFINIWNMEIISAIGKNADFHNTPQTNSAWATNKKIA